jgi:hypothetical protein
MLASGLAGRVTRPIRAGIEIERARRGKERKPFQDKRQQSASPFCYALKARMSRDREPNRRERRRLERNLHATLGRMYRHLLAWIETHPGVVPRFARPSREVDFIAALDEVASVVAKDSHARELVASFCKIGIDVGGPGCEPSVRMLYAVLDTAGVATETVPLEAFGHLGKLKVLSPGSSAEN